MRKHDFFVRTSAFILCTSIILSVFPDINPSLPVKPVETKAAETDSAEYANETLEYLWKNDSEYLNASRPYYTCAGKTSTSGFYNFGGIEKRTIFHVYAFEGETICIGSSVCDSGLNMDHKLTNGSGYGADAASYGGTNNHTDEGSVDVVMTDLNGVKHAIDINGTTKPYKGYIENPDMEHAAVLMEKQGDGTYKGTFGSTEYIPYTYKVQETGIYTFEFHSFDKEGVTNPAGHYKRSDSWPTKEHNYIGVNNETNPTAYYDTGGMIAAINLTVFDESGSKQTGRAYADYLSLQMQPVNGGIKDPYYILTTDSYIYKMKFNGASPYTYNFFANNRGITDNATGAIVYKSVKDISNTNSYTKMGTIFKYPGTKDTELNKSFYIFLEYPDDDLYGHLYQRAIPPDPASNIRFVDTIEVGGEEIPGSYVGVGGYFAFDVEEATTATLRLEFKNIEDGEGKTFAPVEISGVVKAHSTNYFYWDGKDGNGVPIPPGEYSINDIVYTVTTKAGEIHFPIIDMECAAEGITFTRLSHIYDKDGKQLDGNESDKNIYDLTKNVIYYDDTAIYYGEHVAATGHSENLVTGNDNDATNGPAKDFFAKEENKGKFWRYTNAIKSREGGEFYARKDYLGEDTDAKIGTHTELRVGDHSHTSNIIKYFNETGEPLKESEISQEQKNMIAYLDSSTHPVGKTTATGDTTVDGVTYRQSTTDYGIANFWTFIPAPPAYSEPSGDNNITIVENTDNIFNLIGRVFFDSDTNKGKFDDMSTSGEYLMEGVTLNLYKKTEDTSYKAEKKYVDENMTPLTESNFGSAANKYEFVDTGKTTTEGSYVFKNLKYDADNGTEYLYQVVRPNPGYTVTSTATTAQVLKNNTLGYDQGYGYYSNYSFTIKYKGTEIQKILVGGTGADPSINTVNNNNMTVTAVDVGYIYQTLDRSLMLKKEWKAITLPHPTAVVYQLSYKLKDDINPYIYDYRTLSAITSWQNEDEYLPAMLNGKEVDNYYVSAEYYIDNEKGNIYKHSYDDYNKDTGKYESFVSKTYKVKLADIFADKAVPENCKVSDLPDLNEDGSSDGKDMGAITGWEEDSSSKYTAVLDRDIRSDNTTITITNAEQPGTIELLKYHDTPEEGNYLQGATFRVYDGDMATIKSLSGNVEELRKIQVASGSTRSNGRIAFPGLDPTKTYTVREVYAPDGYRIVEEYYEVKAKGEGKDGEIFFNNDNYAFLKVGNALADKDFKIRKQIQGRAWQNNDEFAFDIKAMFDGSDLNKEGSFSVNRTENDFYDDPKMLEMLEKFAKDFSTQTKTVTNENSFYSFTTKPDGRFEVTNNSSDTKVSETLITSEGINNAKFCGIEFPLAGTYTFSVEEKGGEDPKSTLETSKRKYTVEISVSRVPNTEGDDPNPENSHLTAEVSKITYTDGEDTVSKAFAGSSPIFTNTYTPAPAVQSTSYAIAKDFTGRTDNKWLETDKFTVRIQGEDSTTQEAIANENLKINGLGKPESSGDGSAMEWKHIFTGTDHNQLDFNYFMFDDITFPVKYVDKDGNPYEPTDEHPTPSEEDLAGNKYTAQTMPVTYWLEISEDIPTDVKGITYDESKYYLEIILRNTESKVSSDTEGEKEEEDGIIEELDFNLYKDDKTTPVATCVTRQHVVETSDWKKDTRAGITWCYVDKDGNLKDGTDLTSPPSDAKLLIKREEAHTGEHVMTFKNTYATSYTWAPKIRKTLEGRSWLDEDEFEFTMECSDTTGVKMPDNKNAVITKDTPEHTKQFDPVTFTKPGIYTFTFKEKDVTGIKEKESGTYTMEVELKDDGNGSLYGVTGEGAAPELFDTAIEFVNVYADKENSIGFNLTKEIEGRPFNDSETFSFKVTPSKEAKDAIKDGIIIMPDSFKTDGGEYYTFSVTANADEEAYTAERSLGEITVTSGADTRQQYEFTVSEITDDFDGRDMKCFENDILLTLNVERELDPAEKVPTGKLDVSAAYAYISDGGTKPIEKDASIIDIPFKNICMGRLTVEKEVFNEKSKKQEFTFEAEFKYPETTVGKPELSVYDTEGSSITVTFEEKTGAANTYVGTFTLRNDEHIVFKNIPHDTEYTVREKDLPEGYFLLHVSNDIPETLAFNKIDNSVSGELKNSRLIQSTHFVNAKNIGPLPGTGGRGRYMLYAIGMIMLIISGALKLKKCKMQ